MIIFIFGELIQCILKENNLEISKFDKEVKPIKTDHYIFYSKRKSLDDLGEPPLKLSKLR